MPSTVLQRQSEKYSPLGNISAQGIQRLLGAPTLNRLQTVIRESVQNTWDAAKGKRRPLYQIHLRSLSGDQLVAMRESIFRDSLSGTGQSALLTALAHDKLRVLEISDFGTSGLGGPTDASAPPDGEVTDFVDFIRNIGTPRDTAWGGGTYGYGKSSLYGLSACETIVVDTQTRYQGKPERRLIASQLSESFTLNDGANAGRYTGRHWWGDFADTEGECLEPVRGDAAAELATRLGLTPRSEKDLGTSILIINPLLGEEDDRSVLNAIQSTLLWNFWPKMVRYEDGEAAMDFKTVLSGIEKTLPDPEECPPLDLFVDSMRKIKRDEGIDIDCQRPIKHLGKMAISKGLRKERRPELIDSDGYGFPDRSAHVALMRPAELIVKYLPGQALPSNSVEWAGTFLCSSEHEVEKAFADAEPPAHDDWIFRFLPKGHSKTFVKTALKRIKEQMEQLVTPQAVNPEATQRPLAEISERMGSVLAQSLGDGLSSGRQANERRRQRGGGGSARGTRISGLRGTGPKPWKNDQVLAWFEFTVDVSAPCVCEIGGVAHAYIDGERSETAPNGQRPEIIVWEDKAGRKISESSTIEAKVKSSELIRVGVSIPDFVAVSFQPEIVE